MTNQTIVSLIIILLLLIGFGALINYYPHNMVFEQPYMERTDTDYVPVAPVYPGSTTGSTTTTTTTTYENGTQVSGTNGGCFVGGCSSHICSDQPGVVSTCEFREEYGCYQGARCERQPSGACGWTPTPELAACLSSR